MSHTNEVESPLKALGAVFPEGEITLEGVLSLDWNKISNSSYGKHWWDKIRSWINAQQFEGRAPLRGLYLSGHHPETSQMAFSIMLRQGHPLEGQLGLLRILPLIQGCEGWKVFNIFKHDCGEDGVFWVLRVSDSGDVGEVWDFSLLQHASQERTPYYTADYTGTVLGALRHVLKYHPYERLSR